MNPLATDEPSRSSLALLPSEYTAALIQVLRGNAPNLRGAKALEIGCGSGVVLAALGALGAAQLWGVDIEDEAVVESLSLLRKQGYEGIAHIQSGNMWQPVAGQHFDLVVANLPHFPMPMMGLNDRLSTWSCGGTDGRQLLNPFLSGLADHLAPGGRAVITHNAFVSVEKSHEMLRQKGLAMRIALTFLVNIQALKFSLLTPSVVAAEDGRSIHRYGPHVFAEVHIVEITAATELK